MSEKLGEALLEINTNDAAANRGIDKTERNTRRLGVTFDRVAKKALGFGKVLAAAAAAAGAGTVVLVKRTIDHADAMSKAARRAGIMTEALSELAWAGEQSDVSLDKLTNGLARLSYNMGQAATGADKTLAAAFRQLGIDITDADGKLRSADAVLYDIAEAFAGMEAGADKTALAMRIFGRAGTEMITLLDNGRDGLEAFAAEARGLGLVISTEMGQRAEVFNDTLNRIRKGFEGIVVRIAEDLLPQFQAFADWLEDPALIRNAEAMARGVVAAMGWIASAVREVIGWMQTLGQWWGQLRDTVEWLATHDIFGNPIAPKEIDPLVPRLADRRGMRPLSDEAFDDRFTPPRAPFRFADLGDAAGAGGESPADAYADLTASAREFIETQSREREALGLTEQAANALRYEHELLNEAKRADIALTPEQEAELRALAGQMAEAEAATNALADSMEFRSDVFRGFFSDLKAGLGEGKTFWESFRDAALKALDAITDRILDQVIGALDQMHASMARPGGGGPFGGIGSLLGGLFAGFFERGGMIPAGSFGIVGENGPEPVIATSRGAQVLPNSAMGKGAGRVEVVVGLDMDSAGNIVPAIRKVSQQEIAGAAPAIRAAAIGDVGAQMGGLLDDYSRRSG